MKPIHIVKNKLWDIKDQFPAGVQTFIGWERLATLLQITKEFKEFEKIMGFSISRDGITFLLEISNTKQ